MMRTMLVAVLVMLGPALAVAQTNTTGTISPNTTVAQAQTPTTPGGTTTGTTTNGTTTGATTPAPAATEAAPTAFATPRDAAILICGQEFSTGTARLLVFSASASAGAPAIAPGAACAQALSDLFVAGFGVIDVQPFNQQLQYTLVR